MDLDPKSGPIEVNIAEGGGVRESHGLRTRRKPSINHGPILRMSILLRVKFEQEKVTS